MGETRAKLDEARFFLGLMGKHYQEDPGFGYFLSAFIGAARSVLWVMKAEHSHLDGWNQWYDSKNPSPDEAVFLKGVNDLRVRSVKKGTPATAIKLELSVPRVCWTKEVEHFLSERIGVTLRFSLSGLREDPIEPAKATLDSKGLTLTGARIAAVYRAVEEFPEEDVIAVARRYCEWLEALTAECEARFGA